MRCRHRMARGSTNLTTESAPRRSAPAACSRACCTSTPPRRSSVPLLNRSRGPSTALSTLPASAARGRRWSLRRRCCAPASRRMRRRSRCKLWRRRRRSRSLSTTTRLRGATARAAAVDAAVRRDARRASTSRLHRSSASASSLRPDLSRPRLTIHHLVEDGWSLRLIVDMVSRAYSGAALPVGPSYDVKLRHEEEVCAAGGPSELFWREAMRGTPDRRRCCRERRLPSARPMMPLRRARASS